MGWPSLPRLICNLQSRLLSLSLALGEATVGTFFCPDFKATPGVEVPRPVEVKVTVALALVPIPLPVSPP